MHFDVGRRGLIRALGVQRLCPASPSELDRGDAVRWLVCFFVVFAGCVASIPSDPMLTADLACEAARMAVKARQTPAPSPTPPTNACDNCGGTGKLGDGRITVKCPACDGTGKKPKSVLVKPACINGVCPPR